MQLLIDSLRNLIIVAALCLTGASAVILIGAHRDMAASTRASADRAIGRLQSLYWQDLLWRDGLRRLALLPRPDWRTLDTAADIAPGVCLTYTAPTEEPRTLCNTTIGFVSPAPAWFAALDRGLFGSVERITRPLDERSKGAGVVSVDIEPRSALAIAWARVSSAALVAAAMTAVLVVVVGFVVARAILPVESIVARLQHVEAHGAVEGPLPRAPFELGRISDAVNALAERLARTEEARIALMRRLFHVQEEERRALARDLHDEFGQSLSAVGACAASVEAGAVDRPDLAADALAISRLVARMMATLKEALVRLRSQDVDELGLETALRAMAMRAAPGRGAEVSISVDGDLAGVPRGVAVDMFRIAQEFVTNARRHAGARHIALAVRASAPEVFISVEDDGGCDPAALQASGSGHGLLGVRERIVALGGSLEIGRATDGVRISASLPLAV